MFIVLTYNNLKKDKIMYYFLFIKNIANFNKDKRNNLDTPLLLYVRLLFHYIDLLKKRSIIPTY